MRVGILVTVAAVISALLFVLRRQKPAKNWATYVVTPERR